MEDIPRISPSTGSDSGEKKHTSESGSLLIPRIDPSSKHGSKDKPKPKKGKPKMKFGKKQKIVLTTILSLLLVFLIVGFLFYRVYSKAMKVQSSAKKLVSAGESKDISLVKEELENTKSNIEGLRSAYKGVLWLKFVPYFGGFISDGNHGINASIYGIEAVEIIIGAVEPYADIIGFKNGEVDDVSSGQETAQDRLDFVIETIPEIVPKADDLIEKIKLVRGEVDEISADRYPEKLAGREVRSNVKKGIEYVDLASDMIESSKPLLEATPDLLGAENERTYLILFQNDKELRPTGGFLTAYSIAKVNKGRFEPVSSSDIYNLDNNYTPSIPAPQPLIDYLKGPYVLSKKYRLRDMNWSPDFYESMSLFTEEAKSAGISDIDGIIAVDTQILVYLLDAIGPIGVPGFGNFSNEIIPECNCPQVIYELESFADVEGPIVWSENEPGKIVFAPENYENRKKIIGPLMNSILSNALGQPEEKLPSLFEAIFKSLSEKHVLFYMMDEEDQKAVEEFGIAGTIEDFDGDYLHISDANLGGRKSNLYTTQEVAQEIEVKKDGTVEKTVVITYKNSEKYDGWLNSILPNWVRVYVPQGSELIDIQGLETRADPYDELGKTVFAGFFELRPQGVAKITLKYKLPNKFDDTYNLLIQKQPGKYAPLYTIAIDGKEDEFFLKTDKELKFAI